MKRFFEKGFLRFIVLDLLAKKPSHGYEIIHDLENIFHGFYAPSPGSVYPILQLLENLGFAISDKHSGKKVYTITKAGNLYLAEHADIVQKLRRFTELKHDSLSRDLHEDLHATADEIRLLGQTFMQHAPNLNHEQLGHIRNIIRQATHEIKDVIGPPPNGGAT